MIQQINQHEDNANILLELEIEGLPPTVNHLYRTGRAGFRYKTRAQISRASIFVTGGKLARTAALFRRC